MKFEKVPQPGILQSIRDLFTPAPKIVDSKDIPKGQGFARLYFKDQYNPSSRMPQDPNSSNQSDFTTQALAIFEGKDPQIGEEVISTNGVASGGKHGLIVNLSRPAERTTPIRR